MICKWSNCLLNNCVLSVAVIQQGMRPGVGCVTWLGCPRRQMYENLFVLHCTTRKEYSKGTSWMPMEKSAKDFKPVVEKSDSCSWLANTSSCLILSSSSRFQGLKQRSFYITFYPVLSIRDVRDGVWDILHAKQMLRHWAMAPPQQERSRTWRELVFQLCIHL